MQATEIGYGFPEQVAILQGLVDGFDHGVGERDVDLCDELGDRDRVEVGVDAAVVVFRASVDDEEDVLGWRLGHSREVP